MPCACPEASTPLSRPSPRSRCCGPPALSSWLLCLSKQRSGSAPWFPRLAGTPESAGQVRVLASSWAPEGPRARAAPPVSWPRREPVCPSLGAVSTRRGVCVHGEDRSPAGLDGTDQVCGPPGRAQPARPGPSSGLCLSSTAPGSQGTAGLACHPPCVTSASDPGQARAGPTSRVRVFSAVSVFPGPSPGQAAGPVPSDRLCPSLSPPHACSASQRGERGGGVRAAHMARRQARRCPTGPGGPTREPG